MVTALSLNHMSNIHCSRRVAADSNDPVIRDEDIAGTVVDGDDGVDDRERHRRRIKEKKEQNKKNRKGKVRAKAIGICMTKVFVVCAMFPHLRFV